MMHLLILLGGAMVFFGAAGTLSVLTWQDRRRQVVVGRLQEMSRTKTVTEVVAVPEGSEPVVDRSYLILPEGLRVRVEKALIATGHAITFKTLALIAVASPLAVIVLAKALLGIATTTAIAAGLGAMVIVPWQIVRALQFRHTTKFLKLFPDAIDLIVRAVRAGLPVMGAMDAAGRETPNPVGNEFRQMIADIQIGLEFGEALRRAALRIRQVEFDFFVATLILQRESGGNLSETLATLSNVLRRRGELRAKTKAMTAEARTSAIVIGSLPFLAGIALALMSPQYISSLFSDPRGGYLLGAGAASLTVGGLVMRALIRSALK
jgi:tight adherence protein B